MKKETASIIFFEDFEFVVEINISKAEPEIGVPEGIDEFQILSVDGSNNKEITTFFQSKIENKKSTLEEFTEELMQHLDEGEPEK